MEKIEIQNRLKQCGIKSSEKKIKLFSKILEQKNSFDALSLFESMKEEMDRATVYRTLTQFKEKNLIRETTSVDGKQFYESKESKAHPHFICSVCKEVECLYDVPLDLNFNLHSKKIESISVNITGICERCS